LATTHELKTPVAASKLAIETAKKTADEDLKPTLNMALNNMDRLSTLMDRVLLATRLETETGSTLHMEPVELKHLVEGTIRVIKTSLPNSVQFKTTFTNNLTITADVELMQMALSNLITNAVKYSHLGQEMIHIETSIQENRVALSISDNGIGIPDNQKKKIFEKFYRIGDESTRTSRGSGLGLYLVKKILRQHSAIISVQDVQPSGTLFNIVFKRAIVEP
jgi:signal transduction histidine kinase